MGASSVKLATTSTPLTAWAWPAKLRTHRRACKSHSFTVASSLPLTTYLKSLLSAKLSTGPEWPAKEWKSAGEFLRRLNSCTKPLWLVNP
jgi:hypothetical protein